MSAAERLIKYGVDLPSPPAIAGGILEAVKKDESSFGELARIISSDPALTAKLLKSANSSFYALPMKVNSVERALSVMGVEAVKNTALSFVIAKALGGDGEGTFDFDLFWRRSVTTAVGAELVASALGYRSDDVFVCALLQDVGILIMHLADCHEYQKVIDEKMTSSRPVHEVEGRIFGFDHQELGADMFDSWGLPENICLPIRYHHGGPELPEEFARQVEILMLADMLSAVYHGSRSSETISDIKGILGGKHGISEDEIEDLVDSVASKGVELLGTFDIDPGNMKPFSVLLQEANEELGKLNLSYEQLVMEFKQETEKAEMLANELKDANSKLREMAFRDGLTGLFNHRYFQELIERELSRAARHGHPLTLILCDIDHFKNVNDSYGHPGGDVVLKNISGVIESVMRSSDIVARYGGEEFGVILPETDERGGAVFATRLRRASEQMKTIIDGSEVRVTISIGVTTFLPGMDVNDKAAMVDVADKALYLSKQGGRNRVSSLHLTGN